MWTKSTGAESISFKFNDYEKMGVTVIAVIDVIAHRCRGRRGIQTPVESSREREERDVLRCISIASGDIQHDIKIRL
jgi:hypothetical protein